MVSKKLPPKVYYAIGKQSELGGSTEEYEKEYDSKNRRLNEILDERGLTEDSVTYIGEPYKKMKTLEELGLVKNLPKAARSYGFHTPLGFFSRVAFDAGAGRVVLERSMGMTEQDLGDLYKKVSEMIGEEYYTINAELIKFKHIGEKLEKEKPYKNGIQAVG